MSGLAEGETAVARRIRPVPVTPGKRVGTKRRDMRWLAPDGVIWDSKFECEVFNAYGRAGIKVRKTDESDSVAYTRPVRNGLCTQCSAREVVSEHTYTPDLHAVPEKAGTASLDNEQPYYLEAKGYLRAERRSLLRALCKARPDLRLRLLVQRDYKVTAKLTISEWARKYLRIPVAVWTGKPPTWGTK